VSRRDPGRGRGATVDEVADKDVPIGTPLPRAVIDAARIHLLTTLMADLCQ